MIIMYKRKQPAFELYTEDQVTDSMQRQAIYLARRMAKMIQMNTRDRKKEIAVISRELAHFKKTFADIPGMLYEYQDLKKFLDSEKQRLTA